MSWDLLQELAPKVPVKRLVFHEITKEAIAAAIANPRDIDTALVEAQETRRLVDRLYGYGVSPLLWKQIRPGSEEHTSEIQTQRDPLCRLLFEKKNMFASLTNKETSYMW